MCVLVTCYENGETKSRAALRDQILCEINENATKTHEKLRRAYEEHAVSGTQIFRWHKAFLDDRESVEDEPRFGRPCTSKTDENVTKVRDLVRSDRRFRMTSSVLNLNRQTVHDSEKRVHRVRPEIADTWMLHHDNAACHTAISVNEFLAIKGISLVPQPTYSPDLSPCDFFLFPKLKFHLKGRHFGTVDNIQKVVTS